MKIIEIPIDNECKYCKEALKYFKKLHKRNTNAYMQYIIKPITKFFKRGRDLNEEDRIKGIFISPDYNSEGYLTHFHMMTEEDYKNVRRKKWKNK